MRWPGGPGGRSGGGSRRAISGYSARAKRCLDAHLASVDREVVKASSVFFLTATYHRRRRTPREAKKDWRTFCKRFQRAWGRRASFWKLEPQKRGYPHFHSLVLMDESVDEAALLAWVADNWSVVVREPSRLHREWHLGNLGHGNKPCVQRMKNWDEVGGYTSKYLGKIVRPDALWDHPGRFWGILNRDLLPVEITEDELFESQAFKLQRVLRKRLEKSPSGYWAVRHCYLDLIAQAGRPEGRRGSTVERVKMTAREAGEYVALGAKFGNVMKAWSIRCKVRRPQVGEASRGLVYFGLSDRSIVRLKAWAGSADSEPGLVRVVLRE